MSHKTVQAPGPAKASNETTTFGWKCDSGQRCPTGGKNRRTFVERFFATRAAKNHGATHRGCKAHVFEVA